MKKAAVKGFILIALLSMLGCSEQPVSTAPPEKEVITVRNIPSNQTYPNTINFWQKWASLRFQHDNAVKQLNTAESSEDNLKYADWSDWIAKETLSISQVGVDPQLTQLAVEFSQLYRNRAEAVRYHDETTHRIIAYKEKEGSFWTYAEAMVRGFFGDPFKVGDELSQDEKQIQDRVATYNNMVSSNKRLFDDLKLRRDQLKQRYTAEYSVQL